MKSFKKLIIISFIAFINIYTVFAQTKQDIINDNKIISKQIELLEKEKNKYTAESDKKTFQNILNNFKGKLKDNNDKLANYDKKPDKKTENNDSLDSNDVKNNKEKDNYKDYQNVINDEIKRREERKRNKANEIANIKYKCDKEAKVLKQLKYDFLIITNKTYLQNNLFANKSKFDKLALENSIYLLEEDIKENIKEYNQKIDELSSIYEQLGCLYQEAEIIGDPVDVTSGNYVVTYNDFEAQDYLDKFITKRSYVHSDYAESFGNNWQCSLDSRIIRCNFNDVSEYIIKLKENITNYNNLKRNCENYELEFNSYPSNIVNCYYEAYENQDACEKDLDFLNDLKKCREKLLEHNKYVTYGKYKQINSYYGFEDMLIYLDEEGFEHNFFYKTNGVWEELNSEQSRFKKLQGLKKDGTYSNNICCDGGYELIYKSGEKIVFDFYGIIKEKIDRNENKVTFKNINGNISEIILKTGEKIKIIRNPDNYITKIMGPVSGTATFKYSNQMLTEVTDNKGITVSYSYDEKNNLCSIRKADGAVIKINYEYNQELNKNVCVSVTNENNFTEVFDYDNNGKRVQHDYYGLGTELYKIDEHNNTYSYIDFKNRNTDLKRNNEGIIDTVIINGIKKNFEFDSQGNLSSIVFHNGEREYFKYNSFNQIVEKFDRDNFVNKFEYDEKGRMISSFFGNTQCGKYSYYSNGLLKEITENNVVTNFKYNLYGSVIEKTIKHPNGEIISYKWNYDDNNRVKSFTSTLGDKLNYSYDLNKIIITGNGIEIFELYNSRGWLIEEEKKIGKENSIKKKIEYDGVGNIKKIFINDALFSEYEYYPTAILKSFIVWNNTSINHLKQGLKTEYEYDDSWNIVAEYRSIIVEGLETEKICFKKYIYNKDGNNNVVKIKEYMKPEKLLIYDEYGRLLKEQLDDKNVIFYKYSKAGRLLQQRDNKNNVFNYFYNDDGSFYSVFKNCYGNIIRKNYDCYGRVISASNNLGFRQSYKYDSFGNLVNENGINYSTIINYDKKNRVIHLNTKNDSGESLKDFFVVYDDDKREEKIIVNDEILNYIKKDSFNRVIEENNINGHYFYEYDEIGNPIKISDVLGNYIENIFSPDGNIIYSRFSNGDEKTYEYDVAGNICKVSFNQHVLRECQYSENFFKEKKLGSENSIYFNNYTVPSLISNYATGEVSINNSEREIIYTDNYHNSYKYELDEFGRVIKEINPLGESTRYNYDKNGELFQVIDSYGRKKEIIYNPSENSTFIKYDSGEIIEVVRNIFNSITKIKTEDYILEYDYDIKGNIITEKSTKSGTEVNYVYDNFNRCIEKSGRDFDFLYFYDEMSRLCKVQDNQTNQWIKFDFDCKNNLINKKYSNGSNVQYSYNRNNQLEYLIAKNDLNEIIYAEFIVYDKFGRKNLVSDRDGNVYKYKYDERGRLSETVYQFNEDKKKLYLNEAIECGYFVREEPPTNRIALSEFQEESLNYLYKKAGISFLKINLNDNYATENYSYDKNGNLISLKNPYGEIKYTYDKLNRLIKKNYSNTESQGIKLDWNKDNCLEKYESKLKKITFEYSMRKRPVKIINEDLENNEIYITEFVYDGLGRRVLEKNQNQNIEYIYDGMSPTLLSKQLLTDNNFVLMAFHNNVNPNSSDKYYSLDENQYEKKSEYRTVDNTKYTPFGSGIEYNKNENKINKKNDSRAFNVLSAGNIPLIISYIDGNELNNVYDEFLIANSDNEIIGYLNKDADLVCNGNYDTWGNFVGNTEDLEYSGVKNINDSFSELFNFGYRDYLPLLKSFTSEDPLRDGCNWYAYCTCDPVNYEDSLGFYKESLNMSENNFLSAQIVKALKYDKNEAELNKNNDFLYKIIDSRFDCSDATTGLQYFAGVLSNINKLPDYVKDFGALMEDGKVKEAQNSVSTTTLLNSKNTRKVFSGYDRDFLVANKGNPNCRKEVVEEHKKRQECLEKLKDPKNVTAGTVFIWDDSDKTDINSSIHCKHTSTVLLVKTDDDGNNVGFYTFEAHAGGHKTEITYINIEPEDGVYSFDSYKGKFLGAFENEYDAVNKAKGRCGK